MSSFEATGFAPTGEGTDSVLALTSAQQALLLLTIAAVSITILWRLIAPPNRKQQLDLERKLEQAQQTVRDLEDKLMSLEQCSQLQRDSSGGKKEIRIWMDGAFDMMHYGHMNAFRQGRSLGTYLVVGVNSDDTITACKGEPVCDERDRVATVRGCKWVDEVVEGVPYVMSDAYLAEVIDRYNIDYVVHGDDPCIVDGKDVYESAVRAGKYLTIPRTEGISTTDIVGRMLLLTRSHHSYAPTSTNNTSNSNSNSSCNNSNSSNSSGDSSSSGVGGSNSSGNSKNTGSNSSTNSDNINSSSSSNSNGQIGAAAASAAAAVNAELRSNTTTTAAATTIATTTALGSSSVDQTVEYEFASGRRYSFEVTTTPVTNNHRNSSNHSSNNNSFAGVDDISTTPAESESSAVDVTTSSATTTAATDAAVVVPAAVTTTAAATATTVALIAKPFTRKSKFLTTSRILRLFGAGVQAPRASDRVVYIAGAWDMFHAGHIEILQKAQRCGDYVIVGVHNDNIVNQQRGLNFPIMNLHERVLSVLGCKYVNDVLIDAPFRVSEELILTLKIDVVVKGSLLSGEEQQQQPQQQQQQPVDTDASTDSAAESDELSDIYAVPRRLNVLQEIHGTMRLSVFDMVDRIQKQRDRFSEKYKAKAKQEANFYKNKYNL